MTDERTKRLVRSLDRVLRDDGYDAELHLDALAKMVVVTILSADEDKQPRLKDCFRESVEDAFVLLGPIK